MDSLWSQVGALERSLPGEDSADALVEAIVASLQLQAQDLLLDLGCGNGALTDLTSRCCAGSLGVDVDPSMIATAREQFEKPGRHFELSDMLAYGQEETEPARFTKILCHGSFQYLWPVQAAQVLRILHDRFVGARKLLLGALPDLERLSVFTQDIAPHMFETGVPAGYADDAGSSVGVWRTRQEIIRLGQEAGWRVEISSPRGWQGRFRYNALLSRS